MDKLEQWLIDEEQSRNEPQLDIEGLVRGTQGRIKKRAQRRKAAYAGSSMLAVVLIAILAFSPTGGSEDMFSGELFIADNDGEWYSVVSEEMQTEYQESIYWSSLDYLVETGDYLFEDSDDLLSNEDSEALVAYLEEV